MAGDLRAEWIQRVLGVTIGAGSAGAFDEAAFKRSFKAALVKWRDASQSVDGQLGEIRTALLETDDAALHRIAEFGLNGITGRHKVGLQAALLEVGQAGGAAVPPLARKAAQAAREFQAFVQSDPRVKACDQYPDLKTPIGATLVAALGALAQALAVSSTV